MAGKILVLGANGNVGAPLTNELIARGERVKAASRTARAAPGAEPTRFDFQDRATISAALADVDRIFVLAPTGSLDIVSLLTPALTAAIERKIKIVLQTAIGVDAAETIAAHRNVRDGRELRFRQSQRASGRREAAMVDNLREVVEVVEILHGSPSSFTG